MANGGNNSAEEFTKIGDNFGSVNDSVLKRIGEAAASSNTQLAELGAGASAVSKQIEELIRKFNQLSDAEQESEDVQKKVNSVLKNAESSFIRMASSVQSSKGSFEAQKAAMTEVEKGYEKLLSVVNRASDANSRFGKTATETSKKVIDSNRKVLKSEIEQMLIAKKREEQEKKLQALLKKKQKTASGGGVAAGMAKGQLKVADKLGTFNDNGTVNQAKGYKMAAAAASVALNEITKIVKEQHDLAKSLADYKNEVQGVARQFSGWDYKKLDSMRKNMGLTRAEASNLFGVMSEGTKVTGKTADELASVAKSLKDTFGGDISGYLKEYIDLLQKIPELQENIAANNTEGMANDAYMLAKSGKAHDFSKLVASGAFGGGNERQAGADTRDSQSGASSWFEGISDAFTDASYGSASPYVEKIGDGVTKLVDIVTGVATAFGAFQVKSLITQAQQLAVTQQNVATVQSADASNQAGNSEIVGAVASSGAGGGGGGKLGKGKGVGKAAAGAAALAAVGMIANFAAKKFAEKGNEKGEKISKGVGALANVGSAAMMGMQVAGPWGALAGAAVGLVANWKDLASAGRALLGIQTDEEKRAAAEKKRAEQVAKDAEQLQSAFAKMDNAAEAAGRGLAKLAVTVAGLQMQRMSRIGGTESSADFGKSLAKTEQGLATIRKKTQDGLADGLATALMHGKKDVNGNYSDDQKQLINKLKGMKGDGSKEEIQKIKEMQQWGSLTNKMSPEAISALIAESHQRTEQSDMDYINGMIEAAESLKRAPDYIANSGVFENLTGILANAVSAGGIGDASSTFDAGLKSWGELGKKRADIEAKRQQTVLDVGGSKGSAEYVRVIEETTEDMAKSNASVISALEGLSRGMNENTLALKNSADRLKAGAKAEYALGGNGAGKSAEAYAKNVELLGEQARSAAETIKKSEDFLSSLNSEIDTVNGKIAEMEAEIEKAPEAEKAGLRNSLTALEKRRATLMSDRQKTQSTANEARSKYAENLDQLTDFNGAVTKELDAAMNGLKGRVAQSTADFGEQVAESLKFSNDLERDGMLMRELLITAAEEEAAIKRQSVEAMRVELVKAAEAAGQAAYDKTLNETGDTSKAEEAKLSAYNLQMEQGVHKLKGEELKIENNLRKAKLDAVTKEAEAKRNINNLQQQAVDEMKDFAENYGGSFAEVLQLQNMSVQLKRQEYQIAVDELRAAEANGASGEELMKKQLAVQHTMLEAKKAEVGVAKGMMDKMIGAAFGGIRANAGGRQQMGTAIDMMGVSNTRVKDEAGMYTQGDSKTVAERQFDRTSAGAFGNAAGPLGGANGEAKNGEEKISQAGDVYMKSAEFFNNAINNFGAIVAKQGLGMGNAKSFEAAGWGGKLPMYAKGTKNAKKGPAIVGEKGPEVVTMRGGEQVLSYEEIQAHKAETRRLLTDLEQRQREEGDYKGAAETSDLMTWRILHDTEEQEKNKEARRAQNMARWDAARNGTGTYYEAYKGDHIDVSGARAESYKNRTVTRQGDTYATALGKTGTWGNHRTWDATNSKDPSAVRSSYTISAYDNDVRVIRNQRQEAQEKRNAQGRKSYQELKNSGALRKMQSGWQAKSEGYTGPVTASFRKQYEGRNGVATFRTAGGASGSLSGQTRLEGLGGSSRLEDRGPRSLLGRERNSFGSTLPSSGMTSAPSSGISSSRTAVNTSNPGLSSPMQSASSAVQAPQSSVAANRNAAAQQSGGDGGLVGHMEVKISTTPGLKAEITPMVVQIMKENPDTVQKLAYS